MTSSTQRERHGITGEAEAQGVRDPGGARWLASATPDPEAALRTWSARPRDPLRLPCGTAFDLVSAPLLFGRRMVERLWAEGPGCGPLAERGDRLLLLATPGTADRLAALLRWEQWGGSPRHPLPPLLCHGRGDLASLPPLAPGGSRDRWLVPPKGPRPWLPGPEALLWAARTGVRISISRAADQGANVYDVSRRR
ncbi:hypothetical protein [Streptomyces sp. CA-253872]|uniref:hypothetical protein n=1 Tax=Streptomyces sp. CA-253872 TaxID=3240067 RepID=UPI003D91AD01